MEMNRGVHLQWENVHFYHLSVILLGVFTQYTLDGDVTFAFVFIRCEYALFGVNVL